MPAMYDELAGWFHLLTAPDEYADEAAGLLALLDARVTPLATALELGAGGGNLASHLGARLQLTLTDLSPAMLEGSRRINPDAEHVAGDMRTIRLGRTFDAVIIHDAITYMVDEQDLRAALETAWIHTRPGGAAIFLPDWVLEGYSPGTEHGGTDEGQRGLRYLEWDRPLEPDGHTVRTDYIIVTRNGETVDIHHDIHTLGIFSRAAWLTALEETGFSAERIVGPEGLDIFIGRRAGA